MCTAEHVDLESITKVGEGTFGEAFKVTGPPKVHCSGHLHE